MTYRLRASIINTCWSFISNCITLIGGFLVRSVFIRTLGAEYLGLNGLYTSILATLNVTEMGFGTVFTFFLYKPFAENDYNRINSIMHLYRNIYACIGGCVFCLGSIVSFFLPIFIRNSIPSGCNIYFGFYLYLLNSVLSYFFFSYKRTLLVVGQRTNVIDKVLAVTYLLLYITQIHVLLLFKNFYAYILVFLFTTVTSNIFIALYVHRLYPWYKDRGKVSSTFVQELRKKIWGTAISSFRNASRSYIDVIVLSSMFGLVETARYSCYVSLFTVPMVFISTVLFSGISGSLGNYFAVESAEGKYHIFEVFSLTVIVMACILATFFYCIQQDFIVLWVGKEMQLPYYCAVLFPILFFVKIVSALSQNIKNVTGLLWENRYCPIIEMTINLILDVLLAKIFGVAGIVFATVISILFITIPSDFFILFKFYFKRSIVPYILRCLFVIILFCFVAVFSHFLYLWISFWLTYLSMSFVFICLIKFSLIFIVIILLSSILLFRTSHFQDCVHILRG